MKRKRMMHPQFIRDDGRTVTYFPRTTAEFDLLKLLKPEALIKLGCQKWGGDRLRTHWLFPYEWYNCIPDGLPVTDIFGKVEKFKLGVTDDDIRYGALPYGFIQDHFVDADAPTKGAEHE